MNIALIGYGRMGHEIEAIAMQRGHTVKLRVDLANKAELDDRNLKDIDVAIEFSSPEVAFDNVAACLNRKVPVVSGTTGWNDKVSLAADLCRKKKTAFIHSSNFSIGVNLLFRLNRDLARQMDRYRQYSASIEEIHHTKKLDAPSGTALSLAQGIVGEHMGYTGFAMEGEVSSNKIPIRAVREGAVPGTHIITWDSEIDSIVLKHEAKNRQGFALGAVVAAEFISGKEGVFSMSDVLGF
ncbi:MAG: 4-hydroxy-tetrahydrodipicolinate reductase [Bacteroidales bacterium]|nr:4-hydroxy-tetrahydrodipicolinate reductase [Bacteroidales bacterium]